MEQKLKWRNETIVKVEKVTKIYKLDKVAVEAVKDVSFEIRAGEFVSIVGPSGSGKSTLMYLIGLLDKPTSGSVLIEEKNTEKLAEKELAKLRNQKIGFVFQTFNLLPRTSALSNVMLPLQYSDISPSKRKSLAAKILDDVGLSQRVKSLPSQLSGGEEQRVAIARALVLDPALILADEPTGNLDSKSGAQIMEIFAKLNKGGRTIVVVTHDQKVANYTKRKITLEDGQVISDTKRR